MSITPIEIPGLPENHNYLESLGLNRTSAFSPPALPPVPARGGLKVVRCSQQVKRPTPWLWPQRVAMGRLTLLVGERGLGKGAVAVDLVARVSRGNAWPDLPDVMAPVGTTIFVGAKHARQESLPEQLAAAGADLDKICTLDEDESEGVNTGDYSMEDQLAALEEALESTPDCKLVVIDSLAALVERSDARRALAMPKLLESLARIARRHQIAVVAVAHFNLRPSLASVDRLLSLFRSESEGRQVWGVFRNPNDPAQRLLMSLDGNLFEESAALSFQLSPDDAGKQCLPVWGEAVAASLRDVFGTLRFSGVEQAYRDKENHVAVKLRETLSSGPVDRSLLQHVLPGTEDQMYRAAKRIGVVKEKTDFYGGWKWMLPEHHAAWQGEQNARKEQETAERRRKKQLAGGERRTKKAPDWPTAEKPLRNEVEGDGFEGQGREENLDGLQFEEQPRSPGQPRGNGPDTDGFEVSRHSRRDKKFDRW